MSCGTITHLLRAPIVGGSELETLTVVQSLPEFTHRLIFPQCFARWEPSIRHRFPEQTEVIATADVDAEIRRCPDGVLHIQFPFIIVDRPAGHDTVLELTAPPVRPGLQTLFTVHAAVNVPVVVDVHYVFHTTALADRFRTVIPDSRRTICPSPVRPPETLEAPAERRHADDEIRVLWVSRNEEGKFDPRVPEICRAVVEENPHVRFRFVGESPVQRLPDHPRIESVRSPVDDLDAEYRAADLFWFFPDPRVEETWGRTVTEAMGAGLPCVVANHGAIAHQIEHGRQGLVVSDADSCVRALLDLVEAPDRRAAMGTAGHQRARDFFAESISTLRATYRRLLAAIEEESTR